MALYYYDLRVPINKVGEVDTLKAKNEFDENDKKIYLDAKAMNILYCALDKGEFNRISFYASAKDIWHVLKVTHKGTNQVKE